MKKIHRVYNWIISSLRRFFNKCRGRINYFDEGNALPKPLSTQQEQEVLLEIANGNEKMKDFLIEHNLRLVVYIAKKFENTGVAQDDLVSIGAIGLIKAVNSFKIEKKIKLATYASRCIENEILMFLRRKSKTKKDISLDEPLHTDSEGNELLLADILGSDPDMVYKKIESDVEVSILYSIYSKLNEKEQYILKMRFGLFGFEEMTQREVADVLGISQSYISRLEKKLISKMKKEMQKII